MEIFKCKPNKRTYYFLPFSKSLAVNDIVTFLNQVAGAEVDPAHVHVEFETMGFCADFMFRIDLPNLPPFSEYTILCADNFGYITVLTNDQFAMFFQKVN